MPFGIESFDYGDAGLMPTDFSFDPFMFDPYAGFDIGAGTDMLYDTMTGQWVTPDQAMQIDPAAYQEYAASSGVPGTPVTPGQGPFTGYGNTGTPPMQPGMLDALKAAWEKDPFGFLMKGGAAALAAGTLGIGAAGLINQFGGDSKGRSTTSTTTSQPGGMTPEMQALLGGYGGQQGAGYGGGGGLLGLTGQGIGENTGPYGLMDLQAGQLANLPNTAAMPDPYLNAMLSQNAYGMAMGGLPALGDPMLQSRLDQIYQGRNIDIERGLDNYISQVRDRMNQQGWEGGVGDTLRQGPGQALLAPALAEAVRQRGTLAGQRAAQEIQLAQSLPLQAAQLGQFPFNQNLASSQNFQGIAGAYNTPIAMRTQAPISLYNAMNAGRGTNSQTTQIAPGPSLLDAFGPTASLLGGVGGLFGGIGRMSQPNPYGVS
jgi:hypothetical protein